LEDNPPISFVKIKDLHHLIFFTPFQIEKRTTPKDLLKNIMSNNKWKITNEGNPKVLCCNKDCQVFPLMMFHLQNQLQGIRGDSINNFFASTLC